MMDLKRMVTELRSERSRIDAAISALEAISTTDVVMPLASAARPQRKLSAGGRKRISEASKARWKRERQRQANGATNTAAKPKARAAAA